MLPEPDIGMAMVHVCDVPLRLTEIVYLNG